MVLPIYAPNAAESRHPTIPIDECISQQVMVNMAMVNEVYTLVCIISMRAEKEMPQCYPDVT